MSTLVLVKEDRPEAALGLHCSEGGEAAVLPMERDERGQIEVGDAVAVREAERLAADVLADSADRPPVIVSAPCRPA